MHLWFDRFTRLMPVWVVVLGAAGFMWPGGFIILKPYLDALFFCTMIGIGAVLNINDFMPVLKKPHIVLLGIAAQFVIMPALGFCIGTLLGLSPQLRLGLVLVGCVPGAMASNVIAYLARTDVAYSIAITSTATLLAPVLTPALIYLYAHTILEIPFWDMFFNILKIVIAPLVIGCSLRYFFERQVNRIRFVFPAFSTVFLALICAMVVALNRECFLQMTLLLFGAVFLHNLFGLIGGYGAGVMFRFDRRRRRTLAIEVGMQNAGLGALLALKHFDAQTALMPAVYATWCVITASILAEIWAAKN
ncbi:MAG: bile acid:sodium symporter family protein [Deltaproteobacteria bacterium]|nr:bile acid:sodium symporter family protein [Deltaproteobacteria bacterium]